MITTRSGRASSDMLISAAVCPHPPLLVPALAGDIAHELDDLRTACGEAVRRLPDGPLVVVGGDDATRDYGLDASGSLRPYGLDLTVGSGDPVLPISLTIGRWLLSGRPDVRFQAVAFDASPGECLELGRRLAGAGERMALLVMGDGTACRDEKAPGYLDERAKPYDDEVARALGHADAAALATLDPGLSRELQVAGRAAWQVLAGAAGDGVFSGSLLADEAPYGVGYFVASWVRDVS
jgi:hypothetical protein